MSFPTITSPPQSAAEVVVNRALQTLEAVAVYGQRQQAHSGLTWGYYGGRWGGFSVADGTLTLSNGTNYVVVLRSTGVISTSTSNTNWTNTSAYARVYLITASSGAVTAVEDHRAGPDGVLGGGAGSGAGGLSINSQSADYTLVLADANTCIYHPSSDTTPRTWTIPANSSVAFPVGTTITFDNDDGAGALTIAITTDTLVLVGTAGSTGSRTLAEGGRAVALKVTSTRWRISGTAELT